MAFIRVALLVLRARRSKKHAAADLMPSQRCPGHDEERASEGKFASLPRSNADLRAAGVLPLSSPQEAPFSASLDGGSDPGAESPKGCGVLISNISNKSRKVSVDSERNQTSHSSDGFTNGLEKTGSSNSSFR